MVRAFFSSFSDSLNVFSEFGDDKSAAVRLLNDLERSNDVDWSGLDPTQLEAACRMITSVPVGAIPHVHLVFSCPRGRRGVLPVAEFARALASRYGLKPRCTLSKGLVTVTFTRREARA